MFNLSDLFSLKGKKAVVTGGARGIGEAVAKGLAGAGADIAIADFGNVSKAESVVADIKSDFGCDAFCLKTDVTKDKEVSFFYDEIEKRWGVLDILVNAAGICINTSAETTSRDDWYRLIDVNLNAVFFFCQAAVRFMIKQKSGSIINIGSMSGDVVNYPQPQVSYNVSKAGIHMMTKSLAVEWAKYNIRVNAIAPGYIETELTKPFIKNNPDDFKKYWVEGGVQNRIGKPEEIAGAAVYLASNSASFTTGAIITIDGGYTLR